MQTSAHTKAAASPRLSPRSNDGFLLSLGKRVRELRNRRGLTRKMMAREADVSERHLAQLETGEGNVSIVLLRRIAAALHVSLADLFAAEMETRHEKVLIQRFLERLPAHRVEDAMSRLLREFGDEDAARRKRVALIGLRGAGKSTLGLRLGQDMHIPFIELDREIEKDTGMPLGRNLFAVRADGLSRHRATISGTRAARAGAGDTFRGRRRRLGKKNLRLSAFKLLHGVDQGAA